MAVKPSNVIAGTAPVGRGGVTLKDVAERANVSPGVASTVLSGSDNNIRVAFDTRSRVLEAARSLGYRTRRTASVRDGVQPPEGTGSAAGDRKLAGTISVGVITSFNPDTSAAANYDPWEHDITAGFEIALNEGASQTVTHYCNRGRPGHLPLGFDEAIDQVVSFGVDAIALIEISSASSAVRRCVPLLTATGIPFVIVSTDSLAAPVGNVYFDNVNAGYQAAAHLAEQGYGRICFLAPVQATWADERIEGAREALSNTIRGGSEPSFFVFPEAGDRPQLPPFDARVSRWDYLASGYSAAAALLDRDGTPPEAVIAANDGTAVGFIDAALERGFRAGVDYALVGFDDAPQARQNNLTTVRPPREGMGREAARLLLRQLAGDDRGRQQLRLSSHLMTRGSTPPAATLASRKVESLEPIAATAATLP